MTWILIAVLMLLLAVHSRRRLSPAFNLLVALGGVEDSPQRPIGITPKGRPVGTAPDAYASQ
jgi:hypothetical protein